MANTKFDQAPKTLCILRLSAIGDVTHLLPIIATIQQHWPETKITWIIGAIEYQMVKSLPDIEFITFNKGSGLSEYRNLRSSLAGRHFDVLLMMQVSLRANLISLLIRANIKLGYDKKRAKDFHSLFCNHHIEGPHRVHVIDTFFQFIEKLGIDQRNMDWLLKADKESKKFAQNIIGKKPAVIINACSSTRPNNWRNWHKKNYAEVIDYLEQNNIVVILTGGPDQKEIMFNKDIVKLCQKEPVNLTGKTTLPQLLALLESSSCLIAPDTGPAHMGTVAGIPVIGLYASSNPLRTGPYNSQQFLINAYPQAVTKYFNKEIEQIHWGQRVRNPDVMEIITVQKVIEKIGNCMKTWQLNP